MPRDLLSNYVLLGGPLSEDLRDRIFEAKNSMATDAITEHSLSMLDPNYGVLAQGFLKTGLDVNYGGYKMQIASIELGEEEGTPSATVRIRSLTSRKLKETIGAKVMNNVSSTQYCAAGCSSLGIPFVGQPSTVRPTISRDVKEPGEFYEPGQEPSEWTTFRRLAGEDGFYMFEAGNTIYFGKPTWLLERFKPNAVLVQVTQGDDVSRVIKYPRLVNSIDAQHRVEITLDLPYVGYPSLRPGMVINLTDIPQYAGYYLIDSVEMDLLEAQGVTVVCSTPDDPDPIGVPQDPTDPTDPDFPTGPPGSALYFVSRALQQLGDRYVYGAEVDLDDPDPDVWDCCLTGETMVYSVGGPVRMDEIAAGDEVWTWDDGVMAPRKVVAQKEQKTQEIFKIRTRNRTVRASANHPFRVLEREERVRDSKGRWLPVEWVTRYKRVDELERGDLMVVAKSTPLVTMPFVLSDNTPIDEDVAWLMGLFVGDGHISQLNPRVCVYGDIRERAAKIAKEKWNANSSCSDKHGLIINSRQMAKAFIDALGNEKARTKRLPEIVALLGPKLIRAFLRGYNDADGSIDKRGYESYASSSYSLLSAVQALHIMLGDSVSNITTNNRNKEITINGRVVKDAASLHTFEVYPNSNRQGQVILDTYGARRALPDNNFAVERLLSVEPDGEELTYDIQVEGSENFIANGMSVSNSELVQWAAHQVGVYMPDGSFPQAVYCNLSGGNIGVGAASTIRGALLYHTGHIAISLGDGRTIEAANPRSGVTIGTVGSRFTAGYKIPSMIY